MRILPLLVSLIHVPVPQLGWKSHNNHRPHCRLTADPWKVSALSTQSFVGVPPAALQMATSHLPVPVTVLRG